jgi:translocation and assembly module TamB
MFGSITRRKVFIGLIAVTGLAGAALLLAFLAIRAGYIEKLIVDRVQAKLDEYGVRLEVGSLQTNKRLLSFEARDIRAYVGDAPQPFLTINRVSGTVGLRDVLGLRGPTEVRLHSTEVEGLRARYHVDADGRSNLDGLHPSTNPIQRFKLLYTSSILTVRDAEFLYLDRKHRLDGAARDVSLALSPAGNEEMHLVASSRGSQFEYDGRSTSGLDFDLVALVNEQRAKIESLKLQSAYFKGTLSGNLNSWRAFDYQLDALADLNLKECGDFLSPELKLAGEARFKGKVTGSGSDYRVQGELKGTKLTAREVRLNSFVITSDTSGKGAIASGRLNAVVNALAIAGYQVNLFSAIGEVSTTESKFDWRGQLKASTVSGSGFGIVNTSISHAQLKGPLRDLSRAVLTGGLSIGSLVTADVVIGSLNGEVRATPDLIELPSFDGSVFGGIARGSARLAHNNSAQSEVIAELSGVDIDQTIAASLGNRLPLQGKAEGQFHFNWKGADYQGADGAAHITFDGSALGPREGAGGTALDGSIDLRVAHRRFLIDHSVMRTGKSELKTNGTLDWEGAGRLEVDLASTDAAPLQKLIDDVSQSDQINFLDRFMAWLRASEIAVDSGLRFSGSIEGSMREPVIAGRFALDSFTIAQDQIGSVTGDLEYRDNLHIKNAILKQPTGGAANFALDYAFNSENSTSWRGSLKAVDIAPFARFATGLSFDGTVNGNAELSGLPGAMRGKGDVVLENARYEDYEAREVRGSFALNGTRIESGNAVVRLAGGVARAKGWFDTKTKGYDINLLGEGLDIAELLASATDAKVELAGKVDVKLEAASEEFHREESGSRVFDRLNASVTSRELRYGDQSIGDIQLSANGLANVARFDLAANLVGHRYAGSGQVDFTRIEAPATGRIELRDVELAPLIELLSKEGISETGNLTGEIRLAGNLFGDKDRVRLEAELARLAVGTGDTHFEAKPPVLLRLQRDQLDVGQIHLAGPNTNLDISGSIAFGEKGKMALVANGDLNLRIVQTFVQGLTADGTVKVQMTVAGSLAQPRLSGSATVANASFRTRDFPLAMTKGSGRLLFTNDQAQIASFTGEIGGGQVSVTGGAALAGFRPERWRVQSRLNGVRIDYPQDFRTTADGELILQGSRRLQVLSGVVNVRRGELLVDSDLFDLVQRFLTEVSGARTLTSGGNQFPPTQLDIRAVSNDSLVINNKSLDLVAGADLRVGGTLDDPILGGRVTISRGLIDDLFKEPYRITSGLVEFPGVSQRPPRLNLEAETVISGYRITVLIAGAFDNLRITPRSEPPLPQTDVIALMTSGAPPREGITGDSPSQSLAQTQASNLSTLLTQPLSSRIGSNVTGRLFGLNRFSIDPLVTGRGTDPTARITVGRRVTRDLSITYSTNLASNQDQLILIEYRASDRLSFVASRAQDGSFGLDVRLRKRF